jgi:hypothetical protein
LFSFASASWHVSPVAAGCASCGTHAGTRSGGFHPGPMAESWAMPALTRRRDPDANQETWLIHYDDIRVGSIAMRAGVPTDKDQWGLECWLLSRVGSRPACQRDRQNVRCGPRHLRYGLAVAAPQVHRSGFHRLQAAPRLRCMEARDVGCGPQTADAGGRSVNVLLRRGDWNRGYGKPRLCRAYGDRMKFAAPRPFADHEAAARKLVELANASRTAGSISRRSTGRFCTSSRARRAEYKAGLDCAIEKGWLILRESGTFVRFTGAPAASPGRIGHDLCCPQRKGPTR